MALNQLQQDSGTVNMLNITYHPSTSDPFYNSEAAARLSYYGSNGYPTTWCDGVLRKSGGGSGDYARFAQFYSPRRAITSILTMNISGVYSQVSRSGRVRVQVTNVGGIAIADHRLRYAIVETVPYHWQTLDTCWTVCRRMLPSPGGVPISLSPGETRVDSQSFTMDSTWATARTWLAAFVQNDAGKEILQGAWVPLPSFSGVETGPTPGREGTQVVLFPNQPNPFRQSTVIEFHLPRAEEVRLAVYDPEGRLVRTLVEGPRAAGTHRTTVGGLGSGVYFYRLEAGAFTATRRLVSVR